MAAVSLVIRASEPPGLIGLRGYTDMKINKHEIWLALRQLTLMCLKYMKGMFSPNVTWHSYFLILWHSFYGKRAKSLENFFYSSGNAIYSILLKYHEICVQIQTFTDEN